MRTTVTIPDKLFEELMEFTNVDSRSEAVQVAVEVYVRRARLERLRSLRGKLGSDLMVGDDDGGEPHV